jgi:MFS transporter, DHA1 family, multidrug resistance protein
MPRWLPLLLGFLTAIGPVSTDMYLPAFPAIEASLGSGPGSAQATLAAWFLGLAVGQFVQGTLADRFGRRNPLMLGTAIYTATSVGCAVAPDLLTLSICRCLSVFGGSASAVIPRAIVRDISEGLASARLMSRLILVMGAAPILAPTLGGALLGIGEWRLIFWATAAYGVASTVLVWRWLPETLPPRNRISLRLGELAGRYAAILRERSFLSHALIGGGAMFAMFAFIGGAPPVFIETYGLSPQAFALVFALGAAGFIAGSQLNPRLVARFGAARVLRWAVRACGAAALALALLAFLGAGGGVWAIFPPIVAAMLCCGMVMPNAAVGALARHASRAGSASALMGTLQFSLAALSGTLTGLFGDGTARPMALLVLLGIAEAMAAELWRPRRPPARDHA